MLIIYLTIKLKLLKEIYYFFMKIYLFLTSLCLFSFVNCSKKSINYIEKPENKIIFASVDLNKVQQNVIALKDVDKAFIKKEEEVRNKLTKDQQEIGKEYQELEAKKSVLDKNTLEKKAKELEKKAQSFKEKEMSYGKIFEAVKYQLSTTLNQYIQKATASIAEDMGFSIVFTENNLLYKNDAVQDISLEVATALNKEVPKPIDVKNYFEMAEKELDSIKKKRK